MRRRPIRVTNRPRPSEGHQVNPDNPAVTASHHEHSTAARAAQPAEQGGRAPDLARAEEGRLALLRDEPPVRDRELPHPVPTPAGQSLPPAHRKEYQGGKGLLVKPGT